MGILHDGIKETVVENNQNEDVIYTLISENIENVLATLDVGKKLVFEFAVFEKTGKTEMTLRIRIAVPGINEKHCLDVVKKIFEEIGYRYKVADDVVDVGKVVNSNK